MVVARVNGISITLQTVRLMMSGMHGKTGSDGNEEFIKQVLDRVIFEELACQKQRLTASRWTPLKWTRKWRASRPDGECRGVPGKPSKIKIDRSRAADRYRKKYDPSTYPFKGSLRRYCHFRRMISQENNEKGQSEISKKGESHHYRCGSFFEATRPGLNCNCNKVLKRIQQEDNGDPTRLVPMGLL